ncbi:MAG: hypothetical protein ACTSRW_01770 [Candidatus Helarchaeota archaeon]
MVLLELLSDFFKRMTLTPEQVKRAAETKVTVKENEDEPLSKANPMARLLKTFSNMYFNDFFQLDSYPDEEYRELMGKIHEEIISDPVMQETKLDDLKRYSDFSRQMLKVLRTFIKERMKSEESPNE